MRGKIPTVVKQKVVEEIVEGKKSQSEAARRLGIGKKGCTRLVVKVSQ